MSESASRIAELEAQVKALKAANQSKLRFKVSGKGAVSVYGLQRFPVTLYASQWDRLFGAAEEMKGFMEANRESLATKE